MRRLFGAAVALAAAGVLAGGSAPVRAGEEPQADAGAAGSDQRLCQSYSGLPPQPAAGEPAGMVWVPGGSFLMGSSEAYPEEGPRREASVGGFWIDRHEVTNAQFAAFVAATGYRTVAERGLSKDDYPDLPPEALVPGAMVFYEPGKDAPVRVDVSEWWRYVAGASWRRPTGPESSIAGKENHPAVEITYLDAKAYADWAGRSLPTEAEWEFAARGGINGAEFAWGDEQTPQGRWMANSWQGFFPYEDDAADGYHGTAPVGCFAPNGYGLYDMIGNVWEWANDWYVPGHHFAAGERDPKGPAEPAVTSGSATRVIKGGSWLCAPNFCLRYRPSARQPQEADLGASHVGFRTVLRAPGPAGAR